MASAMGMNFLGLRGKYGNEIIMSAFMKWLRNVQSRFKICSFSSHY